MADNIADNITFIIKTSGAENQINQIKTVQCKMFFNIFKPNFIFNSDQTNFSRALGQPSLDTEFSY